jgi:PAS domain S-box-containing protein
LVTVLDVMGLVLLAWPFLPFRLGKLLATLSLMALVPACGVVVLQWVRGGLSIPLLEPPPTITWAHCTLVLAVLAGLNALRGAARRLGWMILSAGALLAGGAGMFVPLPIPVTFSPALTAVAGALAAFLLNRLEREVRRVGRASVQEAAAADAWDGQWRPVHWLKASTALFVAPDLRQLAEAAAEMLEHVVELQVVGLLLLEEKEPPCLRLAACYPPAGGREMQFPFSPDYSPLLEDAFEHNRVTRASRETGEPVVEPLDRIVGSRIEAALALPLAADGSVQGLLLVGHGVTTFEIRQLHLLDALADQIGLALDHVSVRAEITQQARSLAELTRHHRQEIDRLQAVLESIADGVIVTDGDDCVTLLNDAAMGLLRTRTRDDVIGRSFRQVIDLTESAADLGIREGARNNAPAYTMEAVLDLSGRTVRMSMAPVRATVGAQLGAVALLRDVTPQVKASAERERQLAELQEENQKLAQAARRMRELAWAGKREAREQGTDLQEVIDEAVQTVAPLTGGKPVSVVRALEVGLPKVKADAALIQGILVDLLKSSVEHVADGQIAVSASCGDGYVVTSVAHTGATIAPQYVEAARMVFDSGRPLAPAGQDDLWARLSAVRRVVENSGGKTWVKNKETLIIYFSLPGGPPTSLAQASALLMRVRDGGTDPVPPLPAAEHAAPQELTLRNLFSGQES